jgi:1,4-dihydroxy-2-naphthoate octaprenyltransferase
MSTEELQELQEHAEHAANNPSLAPVSVTMAILAVLVAVVSLLGHRAHTEELVLQNKSTDQWAYYQAKNIRRHTDELFADFASVMATSDPVQAAQLREKYQSEANAYRDQQKDIDAEARKLEQETAHERDRANRYDLGEVFLEVALVITSITLLSGRRLFWQSGIVLGVVGLVVAATAPFVR